MTRSQSLVAALKADAGVTALVDVRIYPLVGLPPVKGVPIQNALIYKLDVDFTYVVSGPGPVDATVEIRSWATAYETAHAIADAVHAVLMPAGMAKGFSGLLGGAGGINVLKCLIDKETEGMVAVSADQFVFEVVSFYGLQCNL